MPILVETTMDFKRRLSWLMMLRAVVITVLLATTIASNIRGEATLKDPEQIFILGVIIGTYLITLVFAILLRFLTRLIGIAYIQLTTDALIYTGLVYITGGLDSLFTFLYSLAIIGAAILLYRRGALILASMSSAFFCMMVGLEAFNILPVSLSPGVAKPVFDTMTTVYIIFINLTGFFLIAFLSSYLSEQTRKAGIELEEKILDLKMLQTFNRNIVTSLNDGLVTSEADNKISFFNPSVQEMTGLALNEVLGRPIGDVFPMLAVHVKPDSPSAVGERGRKRLDALFERGDGRRLWLNFSLSPLIDHWHRQIGWIVILQDLTELKKMQDAIATSEKMAALGHLAAGLAHEIRNPLASLSGAVQLIKGRPKADAEGADEQKLLDIVVRETERLNKLITDFLMFAKPGPPRLSTIDLDRIVRDLIEVYCSDKPPNVTVKAELQSGVRINAEENQIKQVLWNLILNAQEAMRGGGVLRVRLLRNPSGQMREGEIFARLEVIDTGCGIPKESLGSVFEPFFTTKEDGSGLGLSIVYSIVRSHGGSVEIESDSGRGTTVSVLLPFVR